MPEKEVLRHLENQKMFAGKNMSNKTLIDFSDELLSRGDAKPNRERRWLNLNEKEDYIRYSWERNHK